MALNVSNDLAPERRFTNRQILAKRRPNPLVSFQAAAAGHVLAAIGWAAIVSGSPFFGSSLGNSVHVCKQQKLVDVIVQDRLVALLPPSFNPPFRHRDLAFVIIDLPVERAELSKFAALAG